MNSGKYRSNAGWLRTDPPLATPAAPAIPVESPPEPPKPEHTGVTCDGCKTSPIVGPRYKCVEYAHVQDIKTVLLIHFIDSAACPDYDLCQNCFDRKIHGTTHRFLKIDSPEEGQRTSMKVS